MGEFARLAAEPSEHQRELWWAFIAIDEPMLTDSGTFIWIGWCPLCDQTKSKDKTTARFDFRRGLLYCDGNDDDSSCFDQRSMSLTNVLVRMGTSG